MDEIKALDAALEELDEALDGNLERARQMKERIVELRDAFASGHRLRDMVPEEQPPLIVRLLSDSTRVLDEYGSRVRRAEARALQREGLTTDQIARLFGVSRQRVSTLLRESSEERR